MSGESGSGWRATAEMSPCVSVCVRPEGLPNANTVSPWRTLEYDASVSAGSCGLSIFSNARSSSVLMPTIRAATTFTLVDSAVAIDPSSDAGGSSTWTRCALATTCALVMM